VVPPRLAAVAPAAAPASSTLTSATLLPRPKHPEPAPCFRMVTGTANIPKLTEVTRGDIGHDTVVAGPHALVLGDGVGGWALKGVDPGRASRACVGRVYRYLTRAPASEPLDAKHEDTAGPGADGTLVSGIIQTLGDIEWTRMGSTTLVCVQLDGTTGRLTCLNVGDGLLLLLRRRGRLGSNAGDGAGAGVGVGVGVPGPPADLNLDPDLGSDSDSESDSDSTSASDSSSVGGVNPGPEFGFVRASDGSLSWGAVPVASPRPHPHPRPRSGRDAAVADEKDEDPTPAGPPRWSVVESVVCNGSRTPGQVFGCPAQIGEGVGLKHLFGRTDMHWDVREGDVVVLASDGVADNLFLRDIEALCDRFAPPSGPDAAKDQAAVDALALRIAAAAYATSETVGRSRPTPFSQYAAAMGYVGLPSHGKTDDISVAVGVMTRA